MDSYYTEKKIIDSLKKENPYLFEIGFQIEDISFAGPEIKATLRRRRNKIEFLYDQRGAFDIFLIKNKLFFLHKKYLFKLLIPTEKYALLSKNKSLDLYENLAHYARSLREFIAENDFFS